MVWNICRGPLLVFHVLLMCRQPCPFIGNNGMIGCPMSHANDVGLPNTPQAALRMSVCMYLASGFVALLAALFGARNRGLFSKRILHVPCLDPYGALK